MAPTKIQARMADWATHSWLVWHWRQQDWPTRAGIVIAGGTALVVVLALCWLVP